MKKLLRGTGLETPYARVKTMDVSIDCPALPVLVWDYKSHSAKMITSQAFKMLGQILDKAPELYALQILSVTLSSIKSMVELGKGTEQENDLIANHYFPLRAQFAIWAVEHVETPAVDGVQICDSYLTPVPARSPLPQVQRFQALFGLEGGAENADLLSMYEGVLSGTVMRRQFLDDYEVEILTAIEKYMQLVVGFDNIQSVLYMSREQQTDVVKRMWPYFKDRYEANVVRATTTRTMLPLA